MGNRPADLRAGLESLLAQRDVVLDVVVVGNGWEPIGLPDGVRGARAAGQPRHPRRAQRRRRRGRRATCSSSSTTTRCSRATTCSSRMAAQFARRPHARADPAAGGRPRGPRGAAALDPARPGRRPRAQQPRDERLGGRGRHAPDAPSTTRAAGRNPSGTPTRASSWPGGSGTRASTCATTAASRCTTRRSSRPGTPSSTATRPATGSGSRGATCPLPVGAAYVAAWAAIGGSRLRTGEAVRETLRGYRIGLAEDGGERRPMSWRTVWRMTRAGHPPRALSAGRRTARLTAAAPVVDPAVVGLKPFSTPQSTACVRFGHADLAVGRADCRT